MQHQPDQPDDQTTGPDDFGLRLQRLREARGLTRKTLAGLVGRSPEWLKKAERRNVIPDLSMLVRLARAMRLPSVDALVGPMEVPVDVEVKRGHPEAAGIEAAVMTWEVLAPGGEPTDADSLARRARELLYLWHQHEAPRQATAALLPRLIRDGRQAVRALEGAERRKAASALVETYALAEHWLAWITDRHVMTVIADRAMRAAEDADDPHALALASWGWGNVMRYVDADTALAVVEQAGAPLRRLMDDDVATTEQGALWGSLQLHQAVTHAQAGRAGDAERHMDAARTALRGIPRGWQHPVTVFAEYNVDIHAVSVDAELSRGGTGAIDIDPDTVPGPYRRSRLWLDAARAWHSGGDHLAAVTALDKAMQTSAENMTYSPPARALAGALVDSGKGMIVPQARRIATDLGVLA